jgi:uncharacterized protein (DUF433 family)
MGQPHSSYSGTYQPETYQPIREDRVSTFTRITIDSKKMGGLPCIRGLRIPVAAIVELVERGTTPAEILAQYPDLEADDIPEALRFAAEVVRRRGLAKP